MFREMTKEDKNLFIALSKEFYASDAVMKPIPEAFHIQTFEECMRSNQYLLCYIIEWEGQAAGFAMLNKTFQHEAGGYILWLEEFYVRKEFRSKGLGRAFLSYLEHFLQEDIRWLRLEVEPYNERAIQLYEAFGYEKLPYFSMAKTRKEEKRE